MDLETLKHKKVAVLGVGVEGVSLADFLLSNNINIALLDQASHEELTERRNKALDALFENKDIKKAFGQNYLDEIINFDVVFRSPGIPYLTPQIHDAKAAGVEISSQIKLFFDLCPCPIIGVTGTKGKGTTASLIAEILKRKVTSTDLVHRKDTESVIARNEAIYQKEIAAPSHKGEWLAMTDDNEAMKPSFVKTTEGKQWNNVYLAGNIGEPAISLIGKLKADDIMILELSSFQLQDLHKSPHIAVVLNISVDHLDYHKDEVEYREAKLPIVKYQKANDFAVINQDYLTSFEFASQTSAKVYYFSGKSSVDRGVYIRKLVSTPLGNTLSNMAGSRGRLHDTAEEVVLRVRDKDEVICRSNEIKLVGHHNLENIAAASVASYLAGANIESIREAVKEFIGLPHRLELAGDFNGIKFYNDSFSTNPEPTIAAVKSFTEPKVLILGGSGKGADFTQMAQEIIKNNVKVAVTIGKEAPKIEFALKEQKYDGLIISAGSDFGSAIKSSYDLAIAGDVILFSPACASFDMFKNYKDRGERFKFAVANLINDK